MNRCPRRCATHVLVVLAALASATAAADAPRGPAFLEVGHEHPRFSNPGQAGLAAGDFDGDGADDLAFVGANYRSVLYVAGKRGDGSIGLKQSTLLPTAGAVSAVLTLPQSNGPAHLLTVDGDGTVREYAGVPLRVLRSFATLSGVSNAALGDVDGDGQAELVVRTGYSVACYRLADATQRWSENTPGPGPLLVAQLDADAAGEIVLGGDPPGRILDGATRARDWQYPDPFGNVAVGALPPAGAPQLVSARFRLTAFSAAPFGPLWDLALDQGFISSMTLVPGPAGAKAIALGLYNGIYLVDPATRTSRLLIPNTGANALAALDVVGTGEASLAYATSQSVAIVDAETGAARWELVSQSLPWNALGMTQAGLPPQTQIYTAIGRDWPYQSSLVVRDYASGGVVWQSAAADAAYDLTPVRFLPTTDGASGNPLMILAGNRNSSGDVLVIDGTTRTLLQRFDPAGTGALQGRRVADAALADMDNDGTADVVLATTAYGTSGTRLMTFRTDGTPIWTSIGMGSPSKQDYGVLVLGPGSGAGDSVVAVLQSSLRAYGRVSHALEWTLEAENTGAAFIPAGNGGPEIVLERTNTLRFHDANSRLLLRTLQFSDTVEDLVVLDGRVDRLLVSSGGRLRLIDGRDGTEIAASEDLGAGVGAGHQVAVVTDGPGRWKIAAINDVGFYRLRLDLSDRVFASGFE